MYDQVIGVRRRYLPAVGAVIVAASLVSGLDSQGVAVQPVARHAVVQVELAAVEASVAVVKSEASTPVAAAAIAANPIGGLLGNIVKVIGGILLAPIAFIAALVFTSGTSGGLCDFKCFVKSIFGPKSASKIAAPSASLTAGAPRGDRSQAGLRAAHKRPSIARPAKTPAAAKATSSRAGKATGTSRRTR